MAINIQFFYGTKDQLPATGGVPGRLFFTTDTKHIYWDNGSATLIDLYEADIAAVRDLVGTDSVATQITKAIDTLKSDTIGTPDTNKTIVEMIKALEAEIMPDTSDPDASGGTISERLTGVEEALDKLVPAEADSGKSVRDLAADEIAKALIPENADESLDTLQEIAAWIQSHPEDAAKMNAAIQTLNGSDTTEGSVAKAVKDAVDALDVAISDAAGEGKYVASITQVDGKIVPVYKELPETALAWGEMSSLANG